MAGKESGNIANRAWFSGSFTGMNLMGIGTAPNVAAEALVKVGRVGVLDVGSSIGCGAGLLVGLGGPGACAFAGGVRGKESAAMASTGSLEYPAGAGGVKPKPARSAVSSSIWSTGAAGRGSAATGRRSRSHPLRRWARGTRSRLGISHGLNVMTYSGSIGCAIASSSEITNVLRSFLPKLQAQSCVIATNLSQNVPVGHFVNFSEHKTCIRKLPASVNFIFNDLNHFSRDCGGIVRRGPVRLKYRNILRCLDDRCLSRLRRVLFLGSTFSSRAQEVFHCATVLVPFALTWFTGGEMSGFLYCMGTLSGPFGCDVGSAEEKAANTVSIFVLASSM